MRLAEKEDRAERGERDTDERDLVARGLTRRARDGRGRLETGRDARWARALRVDGEVVCELARGCVDRDLRKPPRLRDPSHALVRSKVVEERGCCDGTVVEAHAVRERVGQER